jgi:hypothetical protein
VGAVPVLPSGEQWAHRSGYVPKLLGVLLVIAGTGYVFDSVASTVLASPPASVAAATFLGEFLLASGW